jgi:NADH dehydrogenase FAD-containing subunit
MTKSFIVKVTEKEYSLTMVQAYNMDCLYGNRQHSIAAYNNSSPLKSGNNKIMVNGYLKVTGSDNIYALGDCSIHQSHPFQ